MTSYRPLAVVFPDNPAALAVCRELGSAGIPVLVLSANGRGPGAWSRFATPVASPDLYQDTNGFADFLEAGVAEWGHGAVLFPTEDAALLLVERHRDRLAGPFRLPFAAPAVGALLDKRRLQSAAAASGLAVPRTEVLERPEEAARFSAGRWIVKPPCRYRLDDAGRVRTLRAAVGPAKAIAGDVATAAARVLRAGFPALVQEELAGPLEDLCSIGLCVARDGSVVASFAARKRLEYPEPFGDGLIVESIEDPGLEEPARRLLQAAGYWGLCDVEFKRDRGDGGFKLLDANPRPWLWMGLGADAGVHLARAAYALAVGESASPTGRRGRPGHRWISARGTAGFLRREYRPARHGLGLPVTLGLGLARQTLVSWHTYRDPLYLRRAARKAADLGRHVCGVARAAARPAPSRVCGPRGAGVSDA
jgi:predicted ATP-grasp superfamily ATP-dependent carboligase